MPPIPTKPRASLWLVTASLPLLFASGCPQLASDFTKNDIAIDSDGSGAKGGSNDGAGGGGGTTPIIDLSNATSSGGSESSASTSQGGTDAADAGDAETAETAASSSTSTDGGTTVGASANETTETSSTDGTTGGPSTDGGDAMPPECTPETEVCDGLDNDCDDRVDQDEVCGWSCDGFTIAGRGYMFCANPASVPEATIDCNAQGMTLVQIDSADENEALVTEADLHWDTGGGSFGGTRGGQQGQDQQPAFWTGGSDKASEGDWRWTGSGLAFWEGDGDGMAVAGAYENWAAGRPNEDNDTPENCAAVYFREGADGSIETWNDLPCDDSYPFICESP